MTETRAVPRLRSTVPVQCLPLGRRCCVWSLSLHMVASALCYVAPAASDHQAVGSEEFLRH